MTGPDQEYDGAARRRPSVAVTIVLIVGAFTSVAGCSRRAQDQGESLPAATSGAESTTAPTTDDLESRGGGGAPPAAEPVRTVGTGGPTARPSGGPSDGTTLAQGDEGTEVVVLQRMLNRILRGDLVPDGHFDASTTAAVRRFQSIFGLDPTGIADPDTRALLERLDAGRSTALPTWQLPGFGVDDPDGCQVSLIGDSLVALRERHYSSALTEVGCASFVDGFGSRAMTGGWLCIPDDGATGGPVESADGPRAGDLACGPGGLEALDLLREADAFGDLVVIALGTNDAGVQDVGTWTRRWERVMELTTPRPVMFLTTAAATDRPAADRQLAYSTALRAWCDLDDRCVLADWALTATALDPASYADDVHLTDAATRRRAAFIAEVVANIRAGRPTSPPGPPPTVTWPTAPPTELRPTTTSTATTTSTTTTSTATTSTTTTSTTTTSTVASTTSTVTTSTVTTSTGPGSGNRHRPAP